MSKENAVKANAITRLTPEIAAEYARKTRKTVSRDLNQLRKLGLIESEPGLGFRAKKEIVFAFLPVMKRETDVRSERSQGELFPKPDNSSSRP